MGLSEVSNLKVRDSTHRHCLTFVRDYGNSLTYSVQTKGSMFCAAFDRNTNST